MPLKTRPKGTSTGNSESMGTSKAPSEIAMTVLPKPVIASRVQAIKMKPPTATQTRALASIMLRTQVWAIALCTATDAACAVGQTLQPQAREEQGIAGH